MFRELYCIALNNCLLYDCFNLNRWKDPIHKGCCSKRTHRARKPLAFLFKSISQSNNTYLMHKYFSRYHRIINVKKTSTRMHDQGEKKESQMNKQAIHRLYMPRMLRAQSTQGILRFYQQKNEEEESISRMI